MAWMRLKPSEDYLSNISNWLLSVLDSNSVRRGVNEIIAEMCEPYVPERDGNLKLNVAIGPKEIQYRSPYARYQYYGFVMGPNYFRGYDASGNKIFRTPAGTKKYLTSRPLTYHKTGGAFWFETMIAQKGVEMDKRIEDYLEAECQRRGL